MGQTADQLRQEIDGKRDDAAAKIDEIEARVQHTAQAAKNTVEDTMQTARDTVTGTVTDSVEAVKQSFDFEKQINERPLLMLGAAVVGGFVLGGVIGGDRQGRVVRDSDHRSQPGMVQQVVRSSGLDSALSSMTGALAGMASDRLRDLVEESFPEFGHRLRQEMDSRSSSASRSGYSAGASAESRPSYGSGALRDHPQK